MLITILEIFVIFILPVILWQFHLFPGKKTHTNKIIGFLVYSSIAAIIVIYEHWGPSKLGIRLDNFRNGIMPYSLFTILGTMTIFLFSKTLSKKTERTFNQAHLFFGFTAGSIIQEFGYRSFLMPELEKLTSSVVLIVILNALLFALPHIMYEKPISLLIITFIGGLFFASLYYFYPNLILISLSHIILNFVMARFGFVNSFSGD